MVDNVAPARERGLKSESVLEKKPKNSRSRKGAWIEISKLIWFFPSSSVAPARERGLKYRDLSSYIDSI